ncbi:MAG: hypothetical protein HPY66_2294 [Firmicutes bacterium]|nr:hypothetical protein [Bacillota bacterium]MDI6706015.1 efflux RND transporter periplasmic adaptor subunit [Bacillota bacterium]
MIVKMFKRIREAVKQRKRVFWVAVIAVVLIAAFSAQRAGKAVEVKADFPVVGDIKNIVEQTGEIETAKKQDVYALYGGRVKNIPVEIGQHVEEGQPLIEFDLEDLNIRLGQAQAQLAQVQENAVAGAEIAGALAEFQRAAVERERAAENLESAASLFEMGAVSELDYQQAKDAYELSELQLNAAIAALEAAKKGETVQQASMAAAQAEVLLIQRQLEEGKPLANMKGIVLEKNFEKGMIIPPGSLIMRIGDPDSLQARCMFLASEAIDIKQGDAVIIKGDILKKQTLNGRVKKVFPQAVKVMSQLGVEQQRVPVEIEFLESHENLKPGFSVDVEVITEEIKGVLMVPKDAVFEMNGDDYVFVIDGGKARLRKIVAGAENKDWVQVIEGLDEKDRVIIDPPKDIGEGVRVKEK